MMFFNLLKIYLPASQARKQSWWYVIFTNITNVLPLLAIIVGANIAWNINNYVASGTSWVNVNDPVQVNYAKLLKLVGTVPSGVNIYRVPTLQYEFWSFLAECIPIALILFMESYSVGRRIAIKRNELHIMNASQELWANGIANLVGSVSTSYPVSGSFSRSSLNYLSGARTPLSKTTTVIGVIIALNTLTSFFYFIPKAALTAVIFVALYALLGLEDIWEAFVNSKKDFFVLITTLTVTFVFDTAIGIALGLGLSFFIFVAEFVMSSHHKPILVENPKTNHGIAVVKIASDLNFLTGPRIKDFISSLITRELPPPDSETSRSERIFQKITSFLDHWLIPAVRTSPFAKDQLPLAVIIDLESSLIVDLSGLNVLKEFGIEARDKFVKVAFINVPEHLYPDFEKFGIDNDVSNKYVNLDSYISKSNLPRRPKSSSLPKNPFVAYEIEVNPLNV